MMQAVGLKTHIWNNNLKSLLLLAGFPVLLIGLVFAAELLMMGWGLLPDSGTLGGDLALAFQGLAAGAPLAIAVALIWFVIAYFSYQAIIDISTGARKVERKDEPDLYNLLENLAISRGMRTPALRIVETDALNAFATGLQEGHYSVTVTRGLLQTLNQDELQAVLAHELTHVINRDVRLMVIASIFAGIITLMAQVIFRSLQFIGGGRGRKSSGKGGGAAGLIILIALAIAAVGYILAIVIKMTISRKREFIADAGAVELTKDPDAMISALLKISGHSTMHAPETMRAMLLDDYQEGVMGLFATHPPIAKRVDALVRYAGGHLPEPVEPAVETADLIQAQADGDQRPESEPQAASDLGPWESPSVDTAPLRRGPWS